MTTEAAGEKPITEPESVGGAWWPDLAEAHPLSKLSGKRAAAIEEAGHSEVYGIDLATASPFLQKLILQKFLRANADDVDKAYSQLVGTLKWRKSFGPLKAKDETFSKSRFGGLGFVSLAEGVPESSNTKDVVTYNIYGAVKDNKATFGDLDSFLRWRVGCQYYYSHTISVNQADAHTVMELSIAELKLSDAKEPIPDYGKGIDPYQGIQVHDYLNVSFLRQDPDAKAAASKAIETFKNYYPETLSRKLFINVPVLMGWFFASMKLVLR